MKRTPLRRTRRLKPDKVIEADLWRSGMNDVCAMRHEDRFEDRCRGRLDAHHIIYAQTLRSYGHRDFLMDRRNRLSLCRHHHEQHHSGYRMVPREILPVEVWEMAAALNLTWWIEKRYPNRGESRSSASNREQAVTALSHPDGGE